MITVQRLKEGMIGREDMKGSPGWEVVHQGPHGWWRHRQYDDGVGYWAWAEPPNKHGNLFPIWSTRREDSVPGYIRDSLKNQVKYEQTRAYMQNKQRKLL